MKYVGFVSIVKDRMNKARDVTCLKQEQGIREALQKGKAQYNSPPFTH